MKDTPRPHILSKFQPKIWKFLVVGTCPNLLYNQKTQFSPLGVNPKTSPIILCFVMFVVIQVIGNFTMKL